MKLNCSKILISNFHLQPVIFSRYLLSISDQINHCIIEVDSSQLCQKIKQQPGNIGICLSKCGMKQCADLNQVKGIRAAVVHTQYIAKMCRQHNDANICIISTDCIGEKLAADLVYHYLISGFDGEIKNKLRLDLIEQFQTKYTIQTQNQHPNQTDNQTQTNNQNQTQHLKI